MGIPFVWGGLCKKKNLWLIWSFALTRRVLINTIFTNCITGAFIERMRNEEITELMKAMETSFKQYSDDQLGKFSALLEQHMRRATDNFQEVGGEGQEESFGADLNFILKTLRVDVPRFDGANVEDWIYKIEKFFSLHHVAPAMRLTVVAFHLEGEPSTWYQWMERGGALPSWEVFIYEMRKRFGASIYDDPLGRISKLVQTGTIAQFRAEFERLMMRITGVSDVMFMDFFIWGLMTDIRRDLLMSRPLSLVEAMAQAQLFEERNNDLMGRAKRDGHRATEVGTSRVGASGGTPMTRTGAQGMGSTSGFSRGGGPPRGETKFPIKCLTPAEIQEKREKGICFSCDEKYHMNHKCKNRVLLMIGEEEDDGHADEDRQSPDSATEEVDIEVSLNTLSNSVNPRIFRISAKQGTETLEVLVDTGSNNNFIQEALVEKLGLSCEGSKKFKVYMGNGQYLVCDRLCKGVALDLQGNSFVVDLYVLPIWGLDVVLGMQWLRTLGPCIHDHDKLTMEFQWKGKTVRLAGSSDLPTRQLTFTQFSALIHGGAVSSVYRVETVTEREGSNGEPKEDELVRLDESLPSLGRGLLKRFQAVFEEPKQLPPIRNVDHRIHLQPGTSPVNVRPYRYPYFQKDVMEKIVKEMMENGFIRHSSSPYSSPVLLVKKKDGTWRFCVDYRALNAVTVRDRFPIPTIDELLDELGGAVVFSKLDLRAGYHQIRMDRRDVHKTAFRTHDGHYEFVVMPCGLSNAPSTFQAAMNQIFKPYLRKFVIVFFDDILVYSTSLEEHVQHLETVLQCLLSHSFFTKGSKCQFFQSSIEYLGHLVSKEGVQADPSKIEAMTS
ncbi:uncharacterized protein LOC112092413 [Morus notabilis]|uniref:uncharacterized protein LOC112092413 n=1 Tax=Morus notabilis TaxID=981085 RepID=UPI000CED7EE5|nr:uncharacterized protein LOC112092413 [Morus notabilis]